MAAPGQVRLDQIKQGGGYQQNNGGGYGGSNQGFNQNNGYNQGGFDGYYDDVPPVLGANQQDDFPY